MGATLAVKTMHLLILATRTGREALPAYHFKFYSHNFIIANTIIITPAELISVANKISASSP